MEKSIQTSPLTQPTELGASVLHVFLAIQLSRITLNLRKALVDLH